MPSKKNKFDNTTESPIRTKRDWHQDFPKEDIPKHIAFAALLVAVVIIIVISATRS